MPPLGAGRRLRIEARDVRHALIKWDGHDPQENRTWRATDREFFDSFSAFQVDSASLRRFAAPNNDDKATQRTGGYHISRRFWGGFEAWAPRIRAFLREQAAMAQRKYLKTGDPGLVTQLHAELGRMTGASPPGNTATLGITPVSKLLFFACPRMPFFIYDSYVGATLGLEGIGLEGYGEWCRQCRELYDLTTRFERLIPPKRRAEFRGKEDWLKRRSLDLMLYHQSPKNRAR